MERVRGDTSQLLNSCHDLIAYFSMEVGLKNEMPTYSGGLGVLAGDTLKSIVDIGVEAVGVTLLHEKGYFHQEFDASNWQQEKDCQWQPSHLMKPLDVKVSITIENREVFITAWQYTLKGVTGHEINIYFLDTNLEENTPQDRLLTSHLYGGDILYRLRQEMVLGVGGVRLLRALHVYPKKYHMNEGHAAFLIKELHDELEEVGSEEEKRKVIRTLCSFTTHTPVRAGHDAFDKNLVLQQFAGDFSDSMSKLACDGDRFSMTLLALNYASYTNAVARKHRDVSRQMFPDYEIDYITNGVHMNTWVSKHFAALFDREIVDWRRNPMELRNVHAIAVSEIAQAHKRAKQELIDYVNTTTNAGLEYGVFTIGFARRATSYKRADLLFHDVYRLKELSRTVGRMQLIFAGKAHPRDEQGKQIIQHIRQLAADLAPEIKLVFLDNYNMYLGGLLTSGVDLWLNTPRRPLEASGTSGMKAAANGVPSLSVPDGWWIEGYVHNMTGWTIGEENPVGSDEQIDANDAASLYYELEHTILPLFYDATDKYAVVRRNCIAINAAYFNTHRMVKQYLVRAYTRNL